MFTASKYIEVNAPAIARNCITGMLWHNHPIKYGLHKSLEHMRTYEHNQFCSPDDMTRAVNNWLEKAATVEGLKTLINRLRKAQVSPCYKTCEEFVNGDWETDLTLKQIAKLIALEIRPA